MSKNSNKPAASAEEEKRPTARERMAYHREEANKAFETGDKVKAYGHLEGHRSAKNQLNWFMKKTPAERDAYVAEKAKKK